MRLKRCINYLTKEVVGYSPAGLHEWLEQPRPSVYRSMLDQTLYTVGYMHLRGDDPEVDCMTRLDECFRNTHYDNGKPLTCDDYNFFEHYDRDQDYWGWFEEYPICRLFEYNGELHCEIDCTLEELQEFIHNTYEGFSYEHDFGEE